MPVIVLPDLPAPTNPLVGPASCPILAAWCISVSYHKDRGLRQAALCGPAQSESRFIQIHGGKATKVIRWAAIGWGTKPPLPSPNTQNPNEVIMFDDYILPCPGKAADGADVVIYMGEYRYGLQIPPGDNDILTGAAAPYQSNPNVNVYNLTPQDFNTIFTGPSIAPVTPPGDPPPQLIHVP
jgi:hypothetical protein